MGCENSKAAEVQPHNPPSDLEVEDVKGAALSSPEEVVAKVSKAPKATKSTGKAAKAKVENKPAEAAEPAEAAATDLQVEVIANAAETEEAPPAQDAGERIQAALKAAVGQEESDTELLAAISTNDGLKKLWQAADYNGNGGCSLAELDAMAVAKGFKLSKPALMRAYKKTIKVDGDGDDWVEKKEFRAFVINAFFFEKLWGTFDELDADDDRRIELAEFTAGMAKLGVALEDAEAEAEFAKIDGNDGGKVLFDEFCRYVQRTVGVHIPSDDDSWSEGSKPKA